MFLRGFLLVYGEALVAPAMILSRTLNCYLVLLATGIALAAGRALRRTAPQARAKAGPVPDAAPSSLERAG